MTVLTFSMLPSLNTFTDWFRSGQEGRSFMFCLAEYLQSALLVYPLGLIPQVLAYNRFREIRPFMPMLHQSLR